MAKPFRLTLIHPCIGRREGEKYIRLWQMEPLPPAVIAALTPKDVEVRFYDDRLEQVAYDEPTDLVAISIETYTAKRAYQIASEYRSRGIPVVLGGFHATLCPDEAARYAESVVIGEAERIWESVIDDYRHGTPKKFYQDLSRPTLERSTPDRRIFQGKNYLPMRLVESGRGCPLKCDFCAIQTVYQRSQTRRPTEDILRELRAIGAKGKLVFFVDDNVISNPRLAKEFFRELIPLKIRWVSQGTINAGYDEELLELMRRSGCQGILVGFESLDPSNLRSMEKAVNTSGAGYEQALANLHRYGIRIYGSFVFGYDHDTPRSFDNAVAFARRHGFWLTGFAHLTPFPGTPLYQRLEQQGKLLYRNWWLDDAYSYNHIPFQPSCMSPQEIHDHCIRARKAYYSWPSIVERAFHPVNRTDLKMLASYFMMNAMHRKDHGLRDSYPLGDRSWRKPLLEAAR
ncbi:MAG: B12-binding domain-containing radical SAM protein [Oligoflexia bacterium]|nr:B12-binding domain-containing radical SAM protein [Oligoflexia bacterium]